LVNSYKISAIRCGGAIAKLSINVRNAIENKNLTYYHINVFWCLLRNGHDAMPFTPYINSVLSRNRESSCRPKSERHGIVRISPLTRSTAVVCCLGSFLCSVSDLVAWFGFLRDGRGLNLGVKRMSSCGRSVWNCCVGFVLMVSDAQR